MKYSIKSIAIAIALASTTVHAGGIPVVDATAISQSALNSAKELAEMAKQLVEAKNQLEQLKANVNALTGIKGFSDILELGGLNEEILASFDDLLNGNTSNITAKAQQYLDKLPDCSEEKDSSMCESARLAGIAELDYVEKLNKQVEDKLAKVTELSERIKSAKDMKSMAEIQANIALEANSIALIQQQTMSFERLQNAQKQIAEKQHYQKYQEKRWAGIVDNYKNVTTKKDSNLSSLIN